MATTTKVYFQIKDDVVIGHHNAPINPLLLPEGESIKEINTDIDPNKFLGMDAEALNKPDPEFPPPVDQTGTADWVRRELKTLYYELQFTEQLEEDTTDLQALYDAKLTEYNALIA